MLSLPCQILETAKRWHNRYYVVPLPCGGVVVVFNNLAMTRQVRYYVPELAEGRKEFLTYAEDDGSKRFVYSPSISTLELYLSKLHEKVYI